MHMKHVSLLHNTVLNLCDEGAGLVAVIVANDTENVYFSYFSWPVLVFWVLVSTSWVQIMGPSSCRQCWEMICIK